MKKACINAALMLASLVAALLALEFAFRMAYPVFADYDMEMWRYFAVFKKWVPNDNLSFEHYPNRRGTFYGAELKTNSLGFRDQEIPPQKSPGKTRVVMLGDSFMLGWGVAEDKTIARTLENIASQRNTPLEVINMGVGNYNTTMETELFKEKGLALNPDVVVLLYFVNDTEPVPRLSQVGFHLRRHSYLLAFLNARLHRLNTKWQLQPDWKDYYAGLYSERNPGLAANRKALDELADICKQKGIRLCVAAYPDLHQLDPYPFEMAEAHIKGEASRLGAQFTNLRPAMVGTPPESLWVSREDTHGNAKACELAAKALYDAYFAMPSGK